MGWSKVESVLALLDPSAAQQQQQQQQQDAAAGGGDAPADDVLEVSDQEVQQWRAVQQAQGSGKQQ